MQRQGSNAERDCHLQKTDCNSETAYDLETACGTEQQVPVPVWRARHWETALRMQGVQDEPLSSRLQQRFDSSRIELFQFEAGVKVSCPQVGQSSC